MLLDSERGEAITHEHAAALAGKPWTDSSVARARLRPADDGVVRLAGCEPGQSSTETSVLTKKPAKLQPHGPPAPPVSLSEACGVPLFGRSSGEWVSESTLG